MTVDRLGHVPPAQQCSYPVRPGNRVEPLVDGLKAFTTIARACEQARQSVWVTVAFLGADFSMPGGRGSLFEWLQGLAERGLDVRVIFWRNNEGSGFSESSMFSGLVEHLERLHRSCPGIHARWDRAEGRYCQHQKSWLIDAGEEAEIAFVGGINLDSGSVVAAGHRDGPLEQAHDVYASVQGPSATDVHHNFVQRWNEASERSSAEGCWGRFGNGPAMMFPTRVSKPAGPSTVQVQRTIKAGRYHDATPTPEGSAFAVSSGEFSVYEQYQTAIAAARSSIYIENQALGHTGIVDCLDAALERGVDVTVLVPAKAERQMRAARKSPASQPFFERLAALGRHPHFQLAGIAAPYEGRRREIYVHAKVMLVDDQWATIGSCNIGARSFFGDTELNLSVWCPDTVRRLRVELLLEHLNEDTSALTDREAMARWREQARHNASLGLHSTQPWKGIALALDPATYASD
jgi:cardiolipin synthase A/B